MTTTNLSKDEALSLFRKYYSLVHPDDECPGCPDILVDYNVKLQDSASSRGKPMIQATLRVGYLELKRVILGYRLSKCTPEFIRDLQEAMASYFVYYHLQAIQEFIDSHEQTKPGEETK